MFRLKFTRTVSFSHFSSKKGLRNSRRGL